MNVRELIEELKDIDPEHEVLVSYGDNCYVTPEVQRGGDFVLITYN